MSVPTWAHALAPQSRSRRTTVVGHGPKHRIQLPTSSSDMRRDRRVPMPDFLHEDAYDENEYAAVAGRFAGTKVRTGR